MFVDSFRATLDEYQACLGELKRNNLVLENKNLDTGKAVRSDEYDLADRTYQAARSARERSFQEYRPELRSDLLLFYGHHNSSIIASDHSDGWQKAIQELKELRGTAAGRSPDQ